MKKLIILAACAVVCQSHAGLVWSDDFSYTQPNSLGTIGDPAWGGAANSYTIGGTSNVVMKAFGTGWTFVNNAQTATSVATLSLDLKSDAAFSGDSYLRVAMSGTSGNVDLIDFNGGFNSVQTVGTDKYYHFDLVVNNSGAGIAYNGTNIANNTLHIWKDGALVHESATASTVNADGFGLWMNSGGAQGTPAEVMYADNMAWRDNAYAIPEPSTLGLVSAFGGLVLFIRRRLKI